MMSGSDILPTTIHVTTDWPITQRACTAIGVPLCPEDTPLRNTVRAVIGHSLSHDTRLL
ncbi:unnamed protein product [Staurois parvus]|uniref:Uncharacterized protein n=1 Tax=Staurois parvus TaxID=386267 RepID=A0ABN9E7G2_9NEOB|nr:unnamed protein product [Staurois parvus]